MRAGAQQRVRAETEVVPGEGRRLALEPARRARVAARCLLRRADRHLLALIPAGRVECRRTIWLGVQDSLARTPVRASARWVGRAGTTGAGPPERPGTGTHHPGRAGQYRRPDRREAVHQRQHRPVPPGPDQGQDQLPTPRRPHPPGLAGRPGLTAQPGSGHAHSRRGTSAGSLAPHPTSRHRGPRRTCSRHSRSVTRNPRCGVHDSMTSSVASGFSRVTAISEMSA